MNIGSQVFSNPVTELVSNLIWDNYSAYDIFPIVDYNESHHGLCSTVFISLSNFVCFW